MLAARLLESWDRSCIILDNLAMLLDDTNRHAKPTEDGWPLDIHFTHIHKSRHHWLSKGAPDLAAEFGEVREGDVPVVDLDHIRAELKRSHAILRRAFEHGLESDDAFGPYDHTVYFLQHMLWHEGWHVGLIMTALRQIGQEPSEEWEEYKIWDLWRKDEW